MAKHLIYILVKEVKKKSLIVPEKRGGATFPGSKTIKVC